MKDREHTFLYQTMHRRPMPGCLPLFFVVSLALVGALVWVVPVAMPERVKDRGVGRLYYRNDPLLRLQMRHHSPLPVPLPEEIVSACREEDLEPILLYRPLRLLPAPPARLFEGPRDSAVLNAEDLLAFPPEKKNDDEGAEVEKGGES